MRIWKLHVKNYRSIQNESFFCDSLTALVGRNGSGKSSFLSALELFYDLSAKVKPEDFYSEDTSLQIEISVTFCNLNQEAKNLFSAYVDRSQLTVVRVFTDPLSGKSGTYHGIRLQNPDFDHIRRAGGKMDIRRAYNHLRSGPDYSSLPTASSADAVSRALADWEDQNPGRCRLLRDDGQFFGFAQVAQGYLGRFSRFIAIPAVRDALEEATEKRGASMTELMDLVVRSALAQRDDLAEFDRRIQDEYKRMMNPRRLTELDNLASGLSSTLQSYIPDAKVQLQWSELADISIPLPQAQVKLTEDDYEARVEMTGHGLQRLFIITVLQFLDKIRHSEPKAAPIVADTGRGSEPPQLPNLVLAIEEPELYQHPNRQRHLASVLLKLAEGIVPGVVESIQIVYATHSPLFVGLDRFDGIRVLRKKVLGDDKPRATQLKAASMSSVAKELWERRGGQGNEFTADTLRPRLQAILTPWMNEGFFADLVVLVEGEQDRAALLGTAKSNGFELESLGISVIPCFGKRNLDRPLVIFRQLGIPVYVIWDGDYGQSDSRPEDNRYLLRLLQEPEEDWPHFVRSSAACLKVQLETTLTEELGADLFDSVLSEVKQELGILKRGQALKNPIVMQRIIETVAVRGRRSVTLEQIVSAIIVARNGNDESR